MRAFARSVAGALALVVIIGAWALHHYHDFLAEPLMLPADGLVIRVQPGDTVPRVVKRLADQGATSEDWAWRLYTRLEPVTIRAGEYRLAQGLTPRGVLAQLASGDVLLHRFTIVEGWNYSQLRQALEASEVLDADPQALSVDVVMGRLGLPGAHPEGWFLPETYAVARGDTALSVLNRAHRGMREALDGAWSTRAEDLPLDTPYELLILASIVEKETAVPEERATIAGVFVRRLRQNWRLQTDPSVIYGMGESYRGDIRSKDLRKDTPYNTYIRRGLPPTPIAMPGLPALKASANPATGTAMFFVADGKGGHVFSDTLEQHNKAVRAMLERR